MSLNWINNITSSLENTLSAQTTETQQNIQTDITLDEENLSTGSLFDENLNNTLEKETASTTESDIALQMPDIIFDSEFSYLTLTATKNEDKNTDSQENESETEVLQSVGFDDVTQIAADAMMILNSQDYSNQDIQSAFDRISEIAGMESENEVSDEMIKLASNILELDENATLEDKKNIQNQISDLVTTIAVENGVPQEVMDALSNAFSELGTGEEGGDNLGPCLKFGGSESGQEPWCVYFTNWAYDEVLETEAFSSEDTSYAYCNAGQLAAAAQRNGIYAQNDGSYEPQAGDLFNIGNCHVGMVVGSDDEYLYTIEGNADDQVKIRRYAKETSDEYEESEHRIDDITGFIKMNEYYGGSGLSNYPTIYSQNEYQLATPHGSTY